jgi:apolipoprotein D and lipocalin family protein
MMTQPLLSATLLALSSLLLGACATSAQPTMKIVPQVDLPRFMGDWYVIANIPTLIEKGAHNAVESYQLAPDGTISTTFSFRKGGFDGEPKTYHPRGFVREGSGNAVWGMQFLWPFKSDFRIAYLTPDYTQTVIAREKRDYVWIMARTPEISENDYSRILAFLREQGYDVSKIQKVPQRWN